MPVIRVNDVEYSQNRTRLTLTAARSRALSKIRPTSIVSPVLKFLGERAIVSAEGIRVYIDPTSHLGREILETGTYEPETVRLFRENISPGDVVLDLGANEGFFSALAASLAGPEGCVIAVEPQSRLIDIVEINLTLNSACEALIFKNVVAEVDGDTMELTLFPVSNTGASSLVRGYSYGAKVESVFTITPSTILENSGKSGVDFVKVDVEGFEPEVVRSLLPLFEGGRVGKLLLDYHEAILKMRGIDPALTHDLICANGMEVVSGSVGSGYVLYRRR